MKKILLLFMAVLTLSVTPRAFAFTDGALSYEVLSEDDKTAYVDHLYQHLLPSDFDGVLEIPLEATNKGVKYTVTAIRYCLGYNDVLKSVIIPETVTEIGWAAFDKCESLASITIPESVRTIGDLAFNECTSLTSVVIPGSVESVGKETFKGCESLASVTFPESLTSIGEHAFDGCTILASVTFPESVKSIGKYAFNGCKRLRSVTIPESMTILDEYVFNKCESLSSLTIPESVFLIKSSAFGNCYSLKNIYCWAINPPIGEDLPFYGANKSATLHVPGESVEDYKTARVWKDFLNIVGDLSGIEGIEAEGGDAPAEYFTLSGVRINGEALTPGLYIKRQGGKASKVLVK